MADSLPEKFWHEFRGKYGRLPVWLPGAAVALGDVGEFGRGGWTKITTLAALGINVVPDAGGPAVDMEYSSAGGVSITVKTAAQIDLNLPGIPEGHAAIRYSFSRGQAFAFNGTGVKTTRIGNLRDVDNAILAAYERGSWDRAWVAVVEVATAASAVIIIAEESGAEAIVDLDAEIPVGAGAPVGVTAGTALGAHHSLAAGFVTNEPAPVMWRGRYRHSGFLGARMTERGNENAAADGDQPDAEESAMADLEYPDDALTEREA